MHGKHLLFDEVTCENVYETKNAQNYRYVQSKYAALQDLLYRFLLKLLLLAFECSNTVLQLIDILLVTRKIVLCLYLKLFLDQVGELTELIRRKGVSVHVLAGFLWQVDQRHFEPMCRRDRRSQSLSDLAHALGTIFL